MFKKWILPIVIFLAGCASIGPKQIHLDRGRYDDIVAETNQEQLLKNIVRLRYLESTSYLQVTNITASYTLTSSVSASPSWSATNTPGEGTTTTLSSGISPSISYSDTPTISYTPLDSATFVSTLQEPMNFNEIALLFHGGTHDPYLLARLVFNQLGNLDNASISSGASTANIVPTYKAYYRFIDTLRSMLEAKTAKILPVTFFRQMGLAIHFEKTAIHSKNATLLKSMLNIPQTNQDIILMAEGISIQAVDNAGILHLDNTGVAKNLVFVHMRSIYGIMNFLSNAVRIPEADMKAHLIKQITDVDGHPFDWTLLMKGLLTIYSSDDEPKDVMVKTKFNGHWFYIKNSDLDSKVTFTLLVRLLTLTTGAGQHSTQTSPLLTIPVSGQR